MVRFLIRAAIWLGTAAIGLLIANLVLDDMSVSASAFVLDVVIFAALQAIMSPFFAKLAAGHARALLGGVGLFSTFVALVITAWLSSGMSIHGASTWVFATLIVWIVTMLGSWLLPLIFLKRTVERRAG